MGHKPYADDEDRKQRRALTERKSALKKNYGITLEQYNEILVSQNYSCAWCGRHEDEFPKKLAVDHNHETGDIRGLLCNYCNHKVVGSHSNGDTLRRLATYVESSVGLKVRCK